MRPRPLKTGLEASLQTQQKSGLVRSHHGFPVFCHPLSVSLQLQYPDLSRQRWHPLWPVTFKVSTRCASNMLFFRALLQLGVIWLLSLSCQLEAGWRFSSDFSHKQGISTNRTATHWMFFVFQNFLCNP